MTKNLCEEYCAGQAGRFFPEHFADESARRRVVARACRPLDPAVAAELESQNARYAPSASRSRHLRMLRDGAAAVVTGQQVGLFLGPLFNLYKAASSIRAAKQLAEETGAPVVPVFWLQTEDHDLVEVSSCHVPRAEGEDLSLALPASSDDRISMAHLRLPAAVTQLLDSLRVELRELPHATDHLERLARHYQPGVRWVDAFGAAMAEIFAVEGLVIVDPRVPAFASIAAALHRRAIEEATPIATTLLARSAEIEAVGAAPTVHVRDRAPLSFFHPAGPDGPRYRLEAVDGGWREVGGRGFHSTAELLSRLENEPLCFSTSVLLRPVLQDSLLPTAAYVGGPGEVSYFAQLGPLYDAFQLPMPLVVPRAGFRLVEEKTRRLLDRLGVEADCAALGEDEILLRATAGAASSPGDEIRRALLEPFVANLRSHADELAGAGDGMASAIKKAESSVEHAVGRLVSKYENRLRQRSSEMVEAVVRVKSSLNPMGVPQERRFGLSYFAARYGERDLIERVLEAVLPFSPETRDLSCTGPR